METNSVLEGCEVLCLTGDLIACPLTLVEQRECRGRNQYEAGRKEVVEWIEGMSSLHQIVKDGVTIRKLNMLDDNWQAKLKEWGLE